MTKQTFHQLKEAVSKQLDVMMQHTLLTSRASKTDLWDTYLGSFPQGSNPIFRERTEHDCNCCKQFIRSAGNVLTVIDGELVSVWDIDIGGDYQVVADAMSELVKSKGVENIFLNDSGTVGTFESHEMRDSGVHTWNHFHHTLRNSLVVRRADIAARKGKAVTNKKVLKRSLDEITQEAVDVTMELIEQNSLYRGEEHLRTVKLLDQLKREYNDALHSDYYLWQKSLELGASCAIRNTVIGTLMTDLSDGVALETAVKKFEDKVAPHNYKRPKALITKSMIDNANKTVKELGIEDALYRRFAVKDDIKITDVLFADRSVKEEKGIFEKLKADASVKKPKLDKVEKVSIDKFMENILPKADSIEMYLESRHEGNLASLIAPLNAESKNILKWNNNFSWTYNGEVTDSVKARVKAAGGNVSGDLRCSLAWYNRDDLDLHVHEPDGTHIYYSNKTSRGSHGQLDVDMNAGGRYNETDPVENITWPKREHLKEGLYTVKVHNFSKRTTENVGFEVELEFDGEILKFEHPKAVGNGTYVTVVEFDYTKKNGIKLLSSLPSSAQSKSLWNVNTNNFHKVSMMMHSPNHWDGSEIGNKHYFFMLEDCVNPDKARGLYNEFLDSKLDKHRKVLEVLGSKLKAEATPDQLSGLGFSSTQKNSVLCKVKGAFNRVVEIQF